MAAIWLVAVPLAFAPPASAQSGTVLILSTSVNGGTSSPEAQAATADGQYDKERARLKNNHMPKPQTSACKRLTHARVTGLGKR